MNIPPKKLEYLILIVLSIIGELLGIVWCLKALLEAAPQSGYMDFNITSDKMSEPFETTFHFSGTNHHAQILYLHIPPSLLKHKASQAALAFLGTNFGSLKISNSKEHNPVMPEQPLNVLFSLPAKEEEHLYPLAILPTNCSPGDYTLTIQFRNLPPALRENTTLNLCLIQETCLLDYLAMCKHALIGVLLFILSTCLLHHGVKNYLRQSRLASQKHYSAMRAQQNTPCIVFLYSFFPKWSETFLRQDLTLLLEQGLPIKALSLFPGDCEPQEGWPPAEVLSPESTPKPPASPGTLARLLNKVLSQHMHAHLSLYRQRHLSEKLKQRLVALGACHLHAEFADLPALLGAQVATQLGIRYSVGIHAFDIHSCKYPVSMLFKHARFITACNRSAAEALVQKAPHLDRKIVLIYHGINLQKWEYGPLQEPHPACNIVFVGRLVPKKGVPLLIKALKLLKKQDRQIQLTIIGDGPQEAELKLLAAKCQVEDEITWLGVQTPEQVQAALRKATCLCAPSIVAQNGDRDGIPNTILEAMAAGIPVIATKAGSIEEVINENTGWLVESFSPNALADTIMLFLELPREWERRRSNARHLIEENFDARKLALERANLFNLSKL